MMFTRHALLLLLTCLAVPAVADFQVCNETKEKTFISIGFKDGEDWVSEGWWVIEPDKCEVLISRDLTVRYVYLRAESVRRKWVGNYTFCYQTEPFNIVGDSDCTTRGYKTGGYLQIDTGKSLKWTHDLKN